MRPLHGFTALAGVIAIGCGETVLTPIDHADGNGLDGSAPQRSDGAVIEPIDGGLWPACGALAEAAFCETFEVAHPGGRGGVIDETRWSFSRAGHLTSVSLTRARADSVHANPNVMAGNVPLLCGETFSNVRPPNDTRICSGADGAGQTSGQLAELLNDEEGFGVNSMMIRQPFDFTGRTGRIVLDVDAKRVPLYDGHGWWTEVWITADPAPIPQGGAPTVGSVPRDGIGFRLVPSSSACFDDPACVQLGRYLVTRGYAVVVDRSVESEELRTADGALNRIVIEISTERVELLGSDYDRPGELRSIAVIEGLGLHFSRGYVHLQHVQLNANKADGEGGLGASPAQVFRWDNVGFDGPVYPTPRGYDVPDSLRDLTAETHDPSYPLVEHTTLGYDLTEGPTRFTVDGVDLTGAAFASLNFNLICRGGQALRYRFNDGPWHTHVAPSSLGSEQLLRGFSEPVALDELVAGTNTIDVEIVESVYGETIANVDLTVTPSR